jgi:recombination protein RecA
LAKKKQDFLEEMEEKFSDTFDNIFITEDDSGGVISTGALSLDASIGIGGIPCGKVTTIFGAESAGKTTLALQIAKNCILNTDKKSLYIDVENQMDFEYICDLVGDDFIESGRFVLAKPITAENAFEIAESAIRSNEFGVVIFDSVAALASEMEAKQEFNDSAYAPTSRLISRFLKRDSPYIRLNKVAMIFVNQVRDTIGSYVKVYSMPGGHALKHFSSVILQLSKEADIKIGDEPVGIITKFVVKKNKVSVPFRSSSFPIIFGEGVDSLRDVILFSEKLGVLKKKGPYYNFEGENLGQGLMKTATYLKNNPITLDKIKEVVYNNINKTTEKEEPDEPELEDGETL